MADQAGSSEHSALCLRLMQLFPAWSGECGAGKTAPRPRPRR